jgi:hypothetical protein
MPSPFPGMDPYLEHPARWPGVHLRLIAQLEEDLNEKLRPRYYASAEERVYLSDESDPGRSMIVPDVLITAGASRRAGHTAAGQESSAVGTIEPVDVTTLIDEEIHEAYLEIVDAEERTAVCIIEILSPTNKVPGSAGRESYLNKRREVVRSTSHLVEIDLLRMGSGVVLRERLQPHDYLVTVSRKVNGNSRTKAWPIPLVKPLPVIPIPLRDRDPDCMLNLQKIMNSVYQRGAFDLKIDYTRDPVPPLNPEQAAWAREILQNRPPAGLLQQS